MQSRDLMLHAYLRRDGKVWNAFCLEYSLAVQASSEHEARRLLTEQILLYIRDALAGDDRDHAASLLNRTAPLSEWLVFYGYYWFGKFLHLKRKIVAYCLPIPMQPAA